MTSAPSPPPASTPATRVLLERRARRHSLPLLLRLRTLDRRARRDPDFIVAGAQKAGSTSLFAYLAAHPDVSAPLVKEINYFDMAADHGQQWYRRHFPLRNGSQGITGEASPMYMVHPLAMERIARDLPEVKVVAILRDPVTRLVSHYRHQVRLGKEQLGLREALEAEESRIASDLEALRHDAFHRAWDIRKYTYLTRSLYSPQVRRIQQLFPGRHHFLRLEDLVAPQAVAPLCEFLGIRFLPEQEFEAHNVNAEVPHPPLAEIGPDVLRRLRVDAHATCELLGWEPWPTYDG